MLYQLYRTAVTSGPRAEIFQMAVTPTGEFTTNPPTIDMEVETVREHGILLRWGTQWRVATEEEKVAADFAATAAQAVQAAFAACNNS